MLAEATLDRWPPGPVAIIRCAMAKRLVKPLLVLVAAALSGTRRASRSHPAGRSRSAADVCVDHESLAHQRPMEAGGRRLLGAGSPAVVFRAHLRNRGGRHLAGEDPQHMQIDRRTSAAGARLRLDRAGRAPAPHPPRQRPVVHLEQRGELRVRTRTAFVRHHHRSFPQRHVIRIRHGVIQVHSPRQCKWEPGLVPWRACTRSSSAITMPMTPAINSDCWS